MGLGGGVAIDVFEEIGAPTRGVGAILAGNAAARQPLPLARVGIAARVADRIVEVTVTQVFRNTFADPIEAVYTFPLDGGSIVSGFEMQVGERTLHGVVQERGAARQKYQRALDEGRRTALLEQERDDVFTVQLGNLPAGEDATIRLTYSEELTFFDNGLTELRLPLLLGMRYIAGEPLPGASAGHGTESDTDIVPDASRLTPPRLADGFDPQVHLSISVEIEGVHVADLTCSQHATRLGIAGHRTTITLARADERLNRDFVLRWRVAAPGTIAPQLFFYRHPSGERYGIVSAAAAAGTGHPGPRDVIFVLDRSGSMQGTKMASAARACGLLLNTLGPADRFGLLVFNGGTQWLIGGGGADTLVQADRTGIARGERLLREVRANGGTELYPALLEGLGRVGSGDTAGRVPVIVLITDGEVGDEARALELVQRAKARVFTVGVDTSVNSGLLKRLAQTGRGTFVLTEPGGALDDALAAIAREIGAPVVEGLAIAVDGGTPTEVAPERLPDLFAGRAATIAFKAAAGSSVRLTGRRADGSAFAVDVQGSEVDLPAIAHLWARRRLTDLEDQYRLARGDKTAIEAEIVALSTSHGVLSRFTAFVVVDDRQAVVSTGDRRTIVQPVEMPHMWADGAQAFAMDSMPALADVFASAREITTPDAVWEGGEHVVALRSASNTVPGSARSMLARLTSRVSRPGASLTPNEPLERVIAEHVEGLLQLLREIDANGRDARVARCQEVMDRIEKVLALIRSVGGGTALAPLASALSRLRDGLRAAVDAEERLQIAGRALIDVWTGLSPQSPPRGRFWDHV